jgi:membrane protein DedA with SNARE-associated domain
VSPAQHQTLETGEDDHQTRRPGRLTGVLLIAGLVLSFVPGIVLLLNPGLTDPIGEYAYAGVFLVNLLSTATLILPVPGITATANVLIATEASDARFPWIIGILGGAGMAIGEFTAYYAGVFGAHAARTHRLGVPRRFEPLARRVYDAVSTLMHRWGMLTLFVLAAIPDPVFEIAAVTAGSVQMPVKRYFAAVLAGCLVRGLTLAYLGARLPFLT